MGVPKSSASNTKASTSTSMSSPKLGSQPNTEPQHYQEQQQSATNETPSTTTRLPNTTICMPIVYGSIAFPLEKIEEYHTHRWTLYVRGPQNEDLSVGIAKVVFQLHPSFPQSVRELTAPPFEVTEKGWGEFEATIRIVWREATEKAVVLTHFIKLYPSVEAGGESAAGGRGGARTAGAVASGTGATTTKEKDGAAQKQMPKPVVHEFYDEVVFTDPIQSFLSCLMRGSSMENNVPKVKSHEPSVQEQFRAYSDDHDSNVLLEAQKFLETELQSVKERILAADVAKKELDEAISAVMVKSKGSAAGTGAGLVGAGGAKRKNKSGGGSASKKSK